MDGGEMTLAQADAVLQSTQYQHTDTNNPTAGNRSISITVNDGDIDSSVATTTITVAPVNDTSVVDLHPSGGIDYAFTFTEGDAATSIVGTTSITDVDDTTLVSVTLDIGGVVDGAAEALTIGDLTFALDATDFTDNSVNIGGDTHVVDWIQSTGIATITLFSGGEMSIAQADAVIQSSEYQHTDTNNPAAGNRTVAVTVNDGDIDSSVATTTIAVAPTNETSVVDLHTSGGIDYAFTFTEGDAATSIVGTTSVTDVDDITLLSVTLDIGGVVDGAAEALTIGDLTFALDATDFTDSSVSIGGDTYVVDWVQGTSIATITLFGAGEMTIAQADVVLQSSQYQHIDTNNPTAGTRTISITVNDGDIDSSVATSSITVVPLNDSPMVDLDASGGIDYAFTFTEGDTATSIVGTTSVTDVDDTTLVNVTLDIGGVVDGAAEELTIGTLTFALDVADFSMLATIGGLAHTVSWMQLAGVAAVSLDSGEMTITQAEAVLQATLYHHTDTNDPTAGNRTIAITLSDGDIDSRVATTTITVARVNDAPVFTDVGATLAYIEGAAAEAIDATLTITDVDSTDIVSATVTIDSGLVSTEDLLAFASTPRITGSFDASTGVLTLTGATTLANYEAALESITYINSNTDNPNTGNRSLTWLVNDGSSNSATGTSSITVAADNDVPSVAIEIVDQIGTEGEFFSFTIPAGVFTDTDSPTVTLSASLVNNTALPAWLGFNAATGNFSGTPTDGDVDSYAVTVTANDGSGGSVTESFNIVVRNVENAPLIGGIGTAFVTEDNGQNEDRLLVISDALTVEDIDDHQSGFIAERLSGSFGFLSVDAAGGWTYTADNSQQALQQLDSGETVIDSFSVTTLDGTSVNVSITINGNEDESVVAGDITGIVVEDTTLSFPGTLLIEDVDSADNPVSFTDMPRTEGDNGYGAFEIVDGNWSYLLLNDHVDVQSLGEGESLTDTITFTATDGSTQRVNVTINGSDELFESEIPASVGFALAFMDDGGMGSIGGATSSSTSTASLSVTQLVGESGNTFEDASEVLTGGSSTVPAADESTQSDPVNVVEAAEVDKEGEEGGTSEQEAISEAAALVAIDLSDVLNVYQQAVVILLDDQNAESSQETVGGILIGDQTIEVENKALDRFVDLVNLNLNQIEVNNLEVAALTEVVRSDAFEKSLVQLGENLDEALNEQDVTSQLRVASAAGIVAGVSTGILTQVLRVGALLASFMSVVPLWRQFDPLPILSAFDDTEDKADGDDEENVDGDDEVEEIFDRPTKKDD
jgi:VCBS repeat-containing protein